MICEFGDIDVKVKINSHPGNRLPTHCLAFPFPLISYLNAPLHSQEYEWRTFLHSKLGGQTSGMEHSFTSGKQNRTDHVFDTASKRL